MAFDTLINKSQFKTALTATADAIRTKTGSTDLIEWKSDSGFSDIINSINISETEIPIVFYGKALPQTKDDVIMPFRYVSKTQDIKAYCVTKAQGTSSMAYPKKNQTTKIYADAECTEKLKIDFRGWGEQNKFCLKANWIDMSHARNVVSARLWSDVVKSRSNYTELPELLQTSPNQGAVDGFPVKVYADGVYQGRYTLNIPKDAWMANMDDELDTHCILCGEIGDSAIFRAPAVIDGSDWSDEIHDEVPAVILSRWNEVISFVQNSTDEEFKSGLGNYFDVTSLMDYYLFGYMICHTDGFRKNQLYFTYDGLKWYASAYDMDGTWGLDWDGLSYHAPYLKVIFDGGNLLYLRLEALYKDELYARWLEIRADALSKENVLGRFEAFVNICPPWLVAEDYAETTGDGAFTAIPSKDTNNIRQIRQFLNDRRIWFDRYMNIDDVAITSQYTNQIPISTNADGSVYNGIGYKANTFLSGDDVEYGSDTHSVTGYIPCATGDTIRLYNISFAKDDAYSRISFYNAAKELIASSSANMSFYMKELTGVLDTGDNYASFMLDPHDWLEGLAYIRLGAQGITDASIVTVNQKLNPFGTHLVTSLLKRAAIDNDTTVIADGAQYVTTVTATTGHVVTSVVIKMAGIDVTADVYADGVITIPQVTGDICILITAEDTSAYTNQIPISTDANGNVYNGVGYQAEKYINLGSEENNRTTSVTGYIPYNPGDILRFKNMPFNSTVAQCRLTLFDSTKTYTNQYLVGSPWYMDNVFKGVKDSEGNYVQFTIPTDIAGGYVRITAISIDETSVVTINEPI